MSTSTCDTTSICTSGGGAASGSNTLCDKGSQANDNCSSGFKFIKTYSCASADVTCQNTCISACNEIKSYILHPGIADTTSNVSSNSFTRSICNALKVVTGSAGKTFASFAIIAVGIGFFSGKVSWGLMIGVAAGIAAMFGAPSIVAAVSGQDTKTSCDIN
ncbi:MAG: TrbC/VirB2 family protein [Alphaproteobacteria bacterium]